MDVTPDMIDRIAREVLAVLRQRGVQPAGTGGAQTGGRARGASQSQSSQSQARVANAYGGPTSRPGAARSGGHASYPRAEVHPPIGVCTGDYSKFPELAGRLYPAAGGAPNPGNPTSSNNATRPNNATSSSNPHNDQPRVPAYANPVLPSHPMSNGGNGGGNHGNQGNAYGAPAPSWSSSSPNVSPLRRNAERLASQAAPMHAGAGNPLPLVGIVTANQLRAAMDASPDHVAVLARDARLTPLAADLARQHPERLRRVDPGAPQSAAAHGAVPGALPWVWWIDGSCPAVNNIVTTHSSQLRAAGAAVSLTQTVRDLAALVRSNQAAGGLLFVRNAARAMCYANRCASLRAVVGTCFEAVEQGVDEMGANVLVLEYPYQGPRAMEAMVQRVLAQPPRVPAAIERELSDLHRCG